MKDKQRQQLSRRQVVAGAGTVGALAAAAAVVQVRNGDKGQPAPAAGTQQHSDGRYRESAHVLRYYQTARV